MAVSFLLFHFFYYVFEVALMCECKGAYEEEWGSGVECPVGNGLFVHQTESHSALENFQSHQQGSKRLFFLNHQYTWAFSQSVFVINGRPTVSLEKGFPGGSDDKESDY